MLQANQKNTDFRIISTEDGLQLKNSILSLDSYKSGELSFLSVAEETIKKLTPQIITTEETIKILEVFKNKPNVLVCQYNRPFSIGQLKLELLPSGHALGGASLYLETAHESILYAPKILTQKIPILRKLQLKRAKILILDAHTPDPSSNPGKHRQKEKDGLVSAVKSAVLEKKWPIIVCNPISTAQEITKELSNAACPIAVHNHIYKINKVFELYGSELGNYSLFSPRYPKSKVLLIPFSMVKRYRFSPDRPYFVVNSGHPSVEQYKPNHTKSNLDQQFSLNSRSFGIDYQEVIEHVRPKEVYFFGPYAKEYQEAFKKNSSLVVKAIYPNAQPPLL